MRKLILLLLICSGLLPTSVAAIVNPLEVPNNKIGVHILDISEVAAAAKLVNANGGTWGYVTIPIRIDERDPEKWSNFFNDCRKYQVIPILRLTTYFSSGNWAEPTELDLVDFANFLGNFSWPTKNRYLILFNEPNHANEWGGQVLPANYTKLIISAADIFKRKSADFFLISAGLDMSVITTKTSLEAFNFYSQMTKANPNWLNYLDGLSFHAYPNPAFSASPYSKNRFGIQSYRHEINYLAKTLKLDRANTMPIFITETGYLGTGPFFTIAFNTTWTDKNLVTVTPFVLFAGAGTFTSFSLLDSNLKPKNLYNEILYLNKTNGSPLLSSEAYRATNTFSYSEETEFIPAKDSLITRLKNLIFPKGPYLKIASTQLKVEIMDTPAKRAQGLSGRKSLNFNTGMLFVFPQAAPQIFWMKDMHFSIDFIWINSGKIVRLDENVPPPQKPNSRPVVLDSIVPVDQVLEVNAGYIKTHQLKIGASVELIKN